MSQNNPGENEGNPPLILALRGAEFDYSLSLLFSTQYLDLFLNFTPQREAAMWVKSTQKMHYVVEPTCAFYQLLQNVWHSERKNPFFFFLSKPNF